METRAVRPVPRGAAFLGNFLSGMETVARAINKTAEYPLETSLVEWKRRHPSDSLDGRVPLETSLVEWKLQGQVVMAVDPRPLETSLVEWKQ